MPCEFKLFNIVYMLNCLNAPDKHCVKSVQIRSFSGHYFPVLGKYGPEKALYLDTFHAVKLEEMNNSLFLQKAVSVLYKNGHVLISIVHDI